MERRTLGKTLCHATYKGMCGSGLNALRRAMNALHVSQGKRCPNPWDAIIKHVAHIVNKYFSVR